MIATQSIRAVSRLALGVSWLAGVAATQTADLARPLPLQIPRLLPQPKPAVPVLPKFVPFSRDHSAFGCVDFRANIFPSPVQERLRAQSRDDDHDHGEGGFAHTHAPGRQSSLFVLGQSNGGLMAGALVPIKNAAWNLDWHMNPGQPGARAGSEYHFISSLNLPLKRGAYAGPAVLADREPGEPRSIHGGLSAGWSGERFTGGGSLLLRRPGAWHLLEASGSLQLDRHGNRALGFNTLLRPSGMEMVHAAYQHSWNGGGSAVVLGVAYFPARRQFVGTLGVSYNAPNWKKIARQMRR